MISRRLRAWLVALALAALLWLVFAAAERALALAQRFVALPPGLQWTLGIALALFAGAGLVLLWLLLRPRRRRPLPSPPDRDALARRIERLRERGAPTTALGQELEELDRRRAGGRIHVAVFGEISAGKSSLVGALAPQAQIATDVRGGTTREVAHYDGLLADGRVLCLADVPGSREAGGETRETLAREEVLRAHAVMYVCAGDLSRSQAAELDWLAAFGKPLLLVLNKADQWNVDEREQLLARLREQGRGKADAVLAVSAGGAERFSRTLADGAIERVERLRPPQVEALRAALGKLTAGGAAALEDAREHAVLAGLHERTVAVEASARDAEAGRIVVRYARRAVVGALAAVAPGSDLVIQGALAAAMTRELGRLYEVPVTEVEIESFLKQARLSLRTSVSIVLAIAGNALKAFSGLGTLGGGVVHAFAYALIFDSLGKALVATLAEHHALDQHAAGERLKTLLTEANAGRLGQLARLTVDALREPDPDSCNAP